MVRIPSATRLNNSISAHRPRSRMRSALLRSMFLIVLVLAASLPPAGTTAQTRVGPKTYYLALGDSAAFGYQPNGDWNHGYADQWFLDLQQHGVKKMVNYSCMAETSTTFINGGCPWRLLQRTLHSGPQLAAALKFIAAHPGQVSPVSIDIGAVDMLYAGTLRQDDCDVREYAWDQYLATLDGNLTQVILPQLIAALTDATGRRTGDIVILNYENPAQDTCPDVGKYVVELNQHLAQDAARFAIPVADIYPAFNSNPSPNELLCSYTWMCARGDGHLTGGQPGEPGNGYGVVAQVLEQTLGY